MQTTLFATMVVLVVASSQSKEKPENQAKGKPEYQEQIIKSLRSEIDSAKSIVLKSMDAKNAADAEKHVEQIRSNLEKLSREGIEKAKLDPEYLASLAANRDALRLLRTENVPETEKLRVIQAVANDLVAKTAFELKNPNAAKRVVNVIAHTKRQNTNVNGLQVWYVTRAWYGTEKRYERFDKNSSPTERGLPPGAYFLWTQDPADSNRTGKKQPVSVGENGKQVSEVDLPAP